MLSRSTVIWLLGFSVLLAAHLALAPRLNARPRNDVSVEMQVALPRFVQVAMAGGDRYLAANLAGFRALVASTEKMNRDNYRIQGIVQSDAAWLNPAHEDNYYIAAAILPWNGEVDAGDYVLRKAVEGRPFDWWPVFYYAFDQMHFHHDPVAAADWLRFGSRRAVDVNDRLMLENIAARWYERGYDTNSAILVVEAMAKGARDSGFRKYLQMRAERLKSLRTLEIAATEYEARFHKLLTALDELAKSGLIERVPRDPFGFGFAVKDGQPILLNAPAMVKQ